MKKTSILLFSIGLYFNIYAQNIPSSVNLFENQVPIQKIVRDTTKRFPPRKYLELMQTPDANFYDIEKEAEAFFKIVGTEEGSGYEKYMR